jgi:hypothetical protein
MLIAVFDLSPGVFSQRNRTGAIKKPAGIAAGVLSFNLQNRFKPGPAAH